jgi:hypothetical protein
MGPISERNPYAIPRASNLKFIKSNSRLLLDKIYFNYKPYHKNTKIHQPPQKFIQNQHTIKIFFFLFFLLIIKLFFN